MSKISRLLQGRKKTLLSFLLSLLLLFGIIHFRPQSSVLLENGQNNFKLSFHLQKSDEPNLNAILEKLSLPQSLKQGVQFELDTTSSAKLAYVNPVKATISFDKNTINFKGALTRSQDIDLNFENIKIPASSTVAILGYDFRNLLKENLKPSQELSDWIDKNLISQEAQYFIVFGQNNDFAEIIKNTNIDLSALKNLKDAKGESLYKEETGENVVFSLIKFTSGNQESLLTIFNMDGWTYIVSSTQGAKDLVTALKSPSKLTTFPNISSKEKLASVINYNPGTQDLSRYFFFPNQKTTFQDKITKFNFVLKGSSFSGSFSVK